MKAILYIGHGTRSITGATEAKDFFQRVIRRIDVPIQELSFLELTPPSIEAGFKRCLVRGATEIAVVPLFLLAARHIKQDIPRILSGLMRQYPEIPVSVQDPFGVQVEILDVVTELIRESCGNLLPHDRVLIVGRGSSDPEIQMDFEMIREGIKKRIGIEKVSVCYLAAAEPRLKEVLQLIFEKVTGKIIVVPYLLFSGLLITEVSREVRKLQKLGKEIYHTGPLIRHRMMEEIVIERATSRVVDV